MDIERLLAYDDWANGEAIASLERLASPPPKALAIMGHILATEAGWLRRMGEPGDFAGFWPGDDVAALRTMHRDDLPARWRDFFGNPGLSHLSRAVAYTNTQGQSFRSSVEDIVVHVALHSAYHRGQVAAHIRAGDGVPAITDFIHAARSHLIP